MASAVSYKGHRYPVEIISHCVWLYYRFALSLRDISEMMLERGVVVSHETVRQWCAKFGQGYANQLRRRRPRPGDKWHVDEVFIRINGSHHYLWRAVDHDGNVLDVLVQSRRNAVAAKKVLPAAPQGTAVCAARAGHRQAGQLPGRAPRTAVLGRASPVPLFEQPRRELPSAHTTTRAGDETVRFAPAGAAVPLGVQAHHTALPAAPTPAQRIRMATRDDRPIRRMERDHRSLRRSLNGATPDPVTRSSRRDSAGPS